MPIISQPNPLSAGLGTAGDYLSQLAANKQAARQLQMQLAQQALQKQVAQAQIADAATRTGIEKQNLALSQRTQGIDPTTGQPIKAPTDIYFPTPASSKKVPVKTTKGKFPTVGYRVVNTPAKGLSLDQQIANAQHKADYYRSFGALALASQYDDQVNGLAAQRQQAVQLALEQARMQAQMQWEMYRQRDMDQQKALDRASTEAYRQAEISLRGAGIEATEALRADELDLRRQLARQSQTDRVNALNVSKQGRQDTLTKDRVSGLIDQLNKSKGFVALPGVLRLKVASSLQAHAPTFDQFYAGLQNIAAGKAAPVDGISQQDAQQILTALGQP